MKKNNHLCFITAAYICGVLLESRPDTIWWAIILACISGFFFIVVVDRPSRAEAAITLFLLFAAAGSGYFLGFEQSLHYDETVSRIEADAKVTAAGTIYKKEVKNDKYLYYLKDTRTKQNNLIFESGNVIAYVDEDSCSIGDVVSLDGRADLFEPARNDGGFEEANYYRTLDITYRIYADDITIGSNVGFSLREMLFQFRLKLISVFEIYMTNEDSAIMSTLCLGAKSFIDSDTKEAFQKAGISHILAISGLHISVLGLSVFLFLKRKMSFHFACVTSSVVVVIFVMMSGFGVSAVRAMIMFLIAMAARVIGRTYHFGIAISIAALIILIQNPYALFQSGFLFSFCAVIGIWVYSMILESMRANRDKNGIKTVDKGDLRSLVHGWLIDNLKRLTIAIYLQLWILPLTARFYYEVPVYSSLLNLIVIPLCSLLLGFGLAGSILGLLLGIPARLCFFVCHEILDIYRILLGISSNLPANRIITGCPSNIKIVIYYALLIIICICVIKRQKIDILENAKVAVAAGVLLGCLLCANGGKAGIDFLDVGQGDGICINDGSGRCVFIDGGSTSRTKIGQYVIEPYLKYNAVDEVDVWIVTHTDEDHFNGLIELLERGYKINCILLSVNTIENEKYDRIIEAAQNAGAEVALAKEGSTIRLDDAALSCLYPCESDHSEDTNDLSQVWMYEREELKVLLTGDISSEQERLLITRGELKGVDILKVAHHGSKYSSSEEFLNAVSPKLSIISCSDSNNYGHPHEEAVDRITDSGSSILFTMKSGEISIIFRNGAASYKTRFD